MEIKILILPIMLFLTLNISQGQTKDELNQKITDNRKSYNLHYNRLKDSLNLKNYEDAFKFNIIIDSLRKENLYFKNAFSRDLIDSLKHLNYKINENQRICTTMIHTHIKRLSKFIFIMLFIWFF